jgi:parvulin-like peptidyl-prolyl isomerase
MDITTNFPDSHIEAIVRGTSPAENRDDNKLATPLQRLAHNAMSGEEVIELLQRHWLLPQLQKELIIDDALTNITCSPEEIFSAYKAFYHQYQITSDEGRAEWLDRNHCNLVQFEDLVLRTIKLDRFKQITFDSQISSYFLQRKSQLDRVIYSILQVNNFHLAQELFFRIQDGEATFAELAPQYSSGQETQTGGLVGPQELSIPHPVLAQKLLLLRSGQLADPIQIANCFVVIRLEQYLPAQLDAAMRQRLADELYEQWMQMQLKELRLPSTEGCP